MLVHLLFHKAVTVIVEDISFLAIDSRDLGGV